MEITCDYCGKNFEYDGGQAHYERHEHHYCSRSCQGKANNLAQGNRLHGMGKKGPDGKQPKRYRIWQNVKKRAENQGTKFELEPEEIPEIPDKCPILGIEIEENKEAGPKDSSPSLDRIDPNKGYLPDNVRIISNRANRLRQDATLKEMEAILEDKRKHG